jgi:stage II sporulation protein D
VWFDGQYHAQALSGGGGGSASVRGAPAGPAPTLPLPTTSTTEPLVTRPTTTTAPATPTTTAAPGPPTTGGPPPTSSPSTTAPPSGPSSTSARPLWSVPRSGGTTGVTARGRRYRGVVNVTVDGSALRLVNQLDVEEYLRGMGEMPASWPAASLRAQAVAARTYAMRAMGAGGELCDDQRCQVYLGQLSERPQSDRAVADTRGQVVTYGRALADTVYSANGGGISATTEEGFGTSGAGFPYLRAAPYTTRDPDPWTVRIGLADLAARFGYTGELVGAHVSKSGPSGRALEVALEGSSGPQVVPGRTFDAGLGLRSTLFGLRLEQADAAPPAPAPADLIQALPEDAAAAAATPASKTAKGARHATPRALATHPHERLGAWPLLALMLLVPVGVVQAAQTRKRRRPPAPA